MRSEHNDNTIENAALAGPSDRTANRAGLRSRANSPFGILAVVVATPIFLGTHADRSASIQSPQGFAPIRRPRSNKVTGSVEAIPQNIFRATPYNGWPLFEIRVREGQRLKFRREGGKWVGDSPLLFIQFETPSEIDGKQEDVEIADLERQSASLALEILRAEAEKGLRAAEIREVNARQQFEVLDRLRDRNSATQIEHRKAQNTLAIAQNQREQLAETFEKKLRRSGLEVQLAEHRLERARDEFRLADFKRDMSWSRIPVARDRFEEVVVTRITGARGDVPADAGKRQAWVEVVDDRTLQVRFDLPLDQFDRLQVGGAMRVFQGDRSYSGEITSIGAIVDGTTQLCPLIVTVRNEDRLLRINSKVEMDLVALSGTSQ